MSWDEVRTQLTEARTPEEKQAAAVTLIRHIDQRHLDKHIVHMGKNGVAHAIRLSELHLAMQHDEQTYNMVKRVVAGR